MNKWTSALLATAASVVMAASAQAGEGFYIGAGLGVHMPESDVLTTRVPPTATTTGTANLQLDTGWIGDVAVGYKFPSGFRTELDVNYRDATVDTINARKFAGRQRALGLSANLL